jgi:hypothetical protein
MTILDHIWPWSTIRRLKREIDAEREYDNTIRAALLDVDPYYFEKQKVRIICKDPRANFIITGIKQP